MIISMKCLVILCNKINNILKTILKNDLKRCKKYKNTLSNIQNFHHNKMLIWKQKKWQIDFEHKKQIFKKNNTLCKTKKHIKYLVIFYSNMINILKIMLKIIQKNGKKSCQKYKNTLNNMQKFRQNKILI